LHAKYINSNCGVDKGSLFREIECVMKNKYFGVIRRYVSE